MTAIDQPRLAGMTPFRGLQPRSSLLTNQPANALNRCPMSHSPFLVLRPRRRARRRRSHPPLLPAQPRGHDQGRQVARDAGGRRNRKGDPRDHRANAFPTHGFYGEETGQSALDAEYLWLVDPIDGTKAFVREYPLFSTQIALMHRGRLIVGVSSAPVYGELAYAEIRRVLRSESEAQARQRSRVSTNSRSRSATSTSIEARRSQPATSRRWRAGPHWSRYGWLVARANRIRGYGDFLHYHLLAAGKIDAVIESDVNILDIAALAVIVEAAGGKFTDLQGRPPGLETTSVLATNGRLHEEILRALARARKAAVRDVQELVGALAVATSFRDERPAVCPRQLLHAQRHTSA